MSSISNISAFMPVSGAMFGHQPHQKGAIGTFDAVLASFNHDEKSSARKNMGADNILNLNLFAFDFNGDSGSDPLSGLIDELFAKIQSTLQDKINAAAVQSAASPFTQEFQAVFGTRGGPLFDFIKAVTAQRGLSVEQNLALQKVAINNKDATKAPESIAKIAKELQEAGIA